MGGETILACDAHFRTHYTNTTTFSAGRKRKSIQPKITIGKLTGKRANVQCLEGVLFKKKQSK